MKKILPIILLLMFTDILSAQMSYIPYKSCIKTGIDVDDNNTNTEVDKRRRRRGRRGKKSMLAVGGSMATMKIFESSFDDKFRIGLGANAWLNLSTSNAINANLSYFFPTSQEVGDIKNTSSYFLINVHFQQFIVGDNSEDFGLYGLGGIGYIVNFNKTETPAYDISARYTNINLDLGVGAQFNLNFGFLFAELQGSLGLMKYEIPLNPADGVKVPSYINFRTGIKIPLQF